MRDKSTRPDLYPNFAPRSTSHEFGAGGVRNSARRLRRCLDGSAPMLRSPEAIAQDHIHPRHLRRSAV